MLINIKPLKIVLESKGLSQFSQNIYFDVLSSSYILKPHFHDEIYSCCHICYERLLNNRFSTWWSCKLLYTSLFLPSCFKPCPRHTGNIWLWKPVFSMELETYVSNGTFLKFMCLKLFYKTVLFSLSVWLILHLWSWRNEFDETVVDVMKLFASRPAACICKEQWRVEISEM